jgi:hypothetical protein
MILPSQHLIVFYSFVAVVIGFWLILGCLLASFGGWHSLSKLYRSNAKSSGTRFSFATMLLGSGSMPLSYRSCMIIRVDRNAISLSVYPPFRFFHPKLLIPWSVVSSCRQERFWFLKCTSIDLTEPHIRLRFLGKAGKEINECWQEKTMPNG